MRGATLLYFLVGMHFSDQFSAKLKADLLNQHSEYIAGGKEKRQEASRQFFTDLGLVGLLGSSERHAMITRACKMTPPKRSMSR